MKVLDLFSGIGGFSLGLGWAGFETVAFCEIDPFCQKVLKKHWPSVPIFDDIKNLRGSDVGSVDVICGGYPCQPFSLAGKRKGKEDDRHLWPEMRRLIEEVRPAWVISENVIGHIDMGVDQVLIDLENLGYSTAPIVIPASSVGANHDRERVWIIAHSDSSGLQASRTEGNGRGNKVAEWREMQKYLHSFEKLASSIGSKKITAKPRIPRVNDGVPNRVDRNRGLGNAVVPQIPEIIGRAILEAEAS